MTDYSSESLRELVDFNPDGLNQLLDEFRVVPGDLDSPIDAGKARQTVENPRQLIEQRVRLTSDQKQLLLATSDDELRSNLKPILDALREGKAIQVVAVTTTTRGVAAPEITPQTAQIVITIGKGRCKIVITIDL